jgi:PhzF family phenazine biosynthesis protein
VTVRVHQVDAFSRRPFAGNPAGVVTGGEGLSDTEMQAIANELNNSETAFVLPSRGEDHDFFLRYFTPALEVPSCGHATLAALVVRCVAHGGEPGRWRFRNAAGLMGGRVERVEDGWRAWMEQGPCTFEPPFERPLSAVVLEALGLGEWDADPRTPMQVVSTGHSKVLVGVRSVEVLNRIVPDPVELVALSRRIGSNGFFVFTLDTSDVRTPVEARMFAPAIGIREDPVTGNGNGPLGGYLALHGLMPVVDGRLAFRSLQGRRMGRPGHCEVRVEVAEPELRVTVGGFVTPVFAADLPFFAAS